MRGLFITGTDTGVGKTFVACGIIGSLRAAGLRTGAYKPVCSGADRLPDGRLEWADIAALSRATGGQFANERICPQCFLAPLAPPVAAVAEGRQVDAGLLATGRDAWSPHVDALIVEGAGGLLSPVADGVSNADLARQLGHPLLIVAADRLGAINHTLLTVEAALARQLPVAGVILNRLTAAPDASIDTNYAELVRCCRVPVLGICPFGANDLLRPGSPAARMKWQALLGA